MAIDEKILPEYLKKIIQTKRSESNGGIYFDPGFISNLHDADKLGRRPLVQQYTSLVHNTGAGRIREVTNPGYVLEHAIIPILHIASYGYQRI